MPAVSVVIPTRDRAGLLAQTLRSVAEQTFGDLECVVVDDGSVDETPEVVRAFAEADPRFRLVRSGGRGVSAARNAGIAVVRGPYIAFLDDDDLLPPDRLGWQVELLDAEPDLALVYGDTFVFFDGDPERGGLYQEWLARKPESFEALLSNSSIYSPTVRAETVRAAGGFDESLGSAADWEYWLRIAAHGRIAHRPRIGLRYREHAGGMSKRWWESYREARAVVAKHLPSVPMPRRLLVGWRARAYLRRVYTRRLLAGAHEASVGGAWGEARRRWRELLRLRPALLLRRSVLPNALWALLPVSGAPIWRRRRGAA